MGYTIGGADIEEYEFERSWGVNPAVAKGVAIPTVDGGGNFIATGIVLGDYVVYSYGAISFFGIVAEVTERVSPSGGFKQLFSIVDNRIRLNGQIVFGMWNMEEADWGDGGRIQPDIDSSQYASNSSASGADGLDPSEGLDAGGGVPSAGVLSDGGFQNERRRRYYSILPDRHGAQIKMWHDSPLTAGEILNSAFAGAIGSFGFSRDYHAGHSEVVLNVDANNGINLANFISGINREIGLDVTIDGARTLRWERRGTGSFVLPTYPVCVDNYGEALSREATKVTVVGDRALVQLNNVELEPDWVVGWEAFVSEVAWLREVEDVWEIDISTNEGKGERAAMAREVTLYDYVVKKVGDQSDLWDFRRWGEVSRMMIPVWVYVTEVVYRSYRIPVAYEYKGVPLASMELASGLLAAVELSGIGETAKIDYRSSLVEYYPSVQAFVVARGQPLDFLDERSYEAFGRRRQKNLRDEWTVQNDYSIDVLNKSIHFSSPIFLDGDPTQGKAMLHYPNRGDGGSVNLSAELADGKDLLNIVTPNPDYEIMAAKVKASFVFSMGKFSKQYGTGMNRSIHVAPYLSQHLLDMTNGLTLSDAGVGVPGAGFNVPSGGTTGLKEVLYHDGRVAEDQADAVAASVIQKPSTHISGSYTRYGAAGVVLAAYYSSVRVRISPSEGIKESVSLSKEDGGGGGVLRPYEVEERQRARELYPSQRQLQLEVAQLRLIGKYKSSKPVRAKKRAKDSMARIFSHSVGDDKVSTAIVSNKGDVKPGDSDAGDKWNSGHVMWLNDEGGLDEDGGRFGGVVVSGDGGVAKVGASYHVVKSGEVPCLVQGPFKVGDSCGCAEKDNFAKVGGKKFIGVIASGTEYTGTERVVAMVSLGGGSAAVDVSSLEILSSRPAYIPVPDPLPALASGEFEVWVNIGVVNGVLLSNRLEGFVVDSDDFYIALKVELSQSSKNLEVSSVTIETSNDQDTFVNAAWVDQELSQTLPEYIYVYLGHVHKDSGLITNYGKGSVDLTTTVTGFFDSGLTTRFTREIQERRLG